MTKAELNFDTVPYDEDEAKLIAAYEGKLENGTLVDLERR